MLLSQDDENYSQKEYTVVKIVVWPTALYGSEIWALRIEKGGDNKTAGTGNIVMKKNGTSQLERQENKCKSVDICKRLTKYRHMSSTI